MRGMKSLVAPTKRQNFADGGVVGAIKGMFGIKPEDPERARRLAEYQANAAREKEAAKAATAPAQAPAPAITDYAAGSALKRREAAAGLKDGGPVRGPGTGTSDDVPDNVPEGTYIMPADSTRAIGEKTLGGLGMRGIDVNLSNGEFKLPPKQVHAIGVQALNQMKDATHTPSTTEAAKGMKPELFFEGGGVVKRKPEPGIFPNNHQDAGANIYANVGLPSSPPSAPAPAVKDPLDGGAAFGVFPQLAGGKRTTYAMDEKLRTGVEATGPSTFVQATPLEKTIIGGGNGQRMNATQDPRSLTATGMNSIAGVSAPSAPLGNERPDTPAQAPSGAPVPGSAQAPDSNPTTGNVTRVGNSYSGANVAGDITVNGQAPRGGFMNTGDSGSGATRSPVGMSAEQAQREGLIGERVGYNPAYDSRLTEAKGAPNAQNMAAADALAGRSQQESMNRVTARGMGSLAQSVSAPTVPHSGNSWQARNDLRNAEVSAKSITQTDRWGKGGDRTATQTYLAALQADAAARGAQPGLDAAAMRESAGIQREGMQQDGATTRTVIQEQGSNSRAAVSSALQRDEFGLKKEAAGFRARTAKRIEDLQNSYQGAKTQDERNAIAKQIRELQGTSTQQDVWAHSPGGQVIDPKTQQLITQPGVIYNRATGETRADSASTRLPPLAENPAVQQIMTNTALSREERAKQIRALGYQ
ncbi:MAG: hypothetical protein ACK4OE_08960 [Acidovorax sp.]|uniref:hypothetical protein n=1 Tax=Acidovorax sp. TaxID=1872122 RepID=UPI00391930B3